MKQLIVPSQIIGVEDKITANLTLSQVVLLILSILSAGAVFILVSPVLKVSVVKLILASFLALILVLLSIRVKEKIILFWVILLARFSLRPRIYTFNKISPLEDVGEDTTVELPDNLTITSPNDNYHKLLQAKILAFKPVRGGRISVAWQEKR